MIANLLNPSLSLRIQPIDKVSESRDFVLNSQIAIRLGRRRGYTYTAQIKIDRHDFRDLKKLFGWIDHEVLQAQLERGGLEMKLGFLDKFRERQKSRAWYAREKIRVAFREGIEVKKVFLQIGT
jgi:hypothetical protein